MAAFREDMDAMSWLTHQADDTTVAGLEKGTLAVLTDTYGTDAVPDHVEDKLRSIAGADFGTASDEQIFAATNELAQEVGAAESQHPAHEEAADQTDAGADFTMPSDEEMVQLITTAIVEDGEFRAALDAQWQQDVEIPPDQFDQVVEHLVDMVKEGLWQGLVAAMSELGDTDPVETWTEEEIEQTLKQLG